MNAAVDGQRSENSRVSRIGAGAGLDRAGNTPLGGPLSW
jgi:hypothetical protein